MYYIIAKWNHENMMSLQSYDVLFVWWIVHDSYDEKCNSLSNLKLELQDWQHFLEGKKTVTASSYWSWLGNTLCFCLSSGHKSTGKHCQSGQSFWAKLSSCCCCCKGGWAYWSTSLSGLIVNCWCHDPHWLYNSSVYGSKAAKVSSKTRNLAARPNFTVTSLTSVT